MKYLMLVVLMMLGSATYAEQIELTCQVPDAREDGTALQLNEISNYTYLGYPAGGGMQSDWSMVDNTPANCGYTITLSPGQCYEQGYTFRVTTTDMDGLTSRLSDPVFLDQVCAPKANPNPPSGLGITVSSN